MSSIPNKKETSLSKEQEAQIDKILELTRPGTYKLIMHLTGNSYYTVQAVMQKKHWNQAIADAGMKTIAMTEKEFAYALVEAKIEFSIKYANALKIKEAKRSRLRKELAK